MIQGLARQMSLQFLGTQIDAVYHTAIVFGGIEYYFGAGYVSPKACYPDPGSSSNFRHATRMVCPGDASCSSGRLLEFGNADSASTNRVQTTYPGATHHGRPMEIVKLGRTELPIEVILEYLESLKAVYTAEVALLMRGIAISKLMCIQSYDLFLHNCNNFSNDFAMFLVGKGIPSHITSLPQTVLNTPFGQMLKPQLDQAMRGITQAPTPPSAIPRGNVPLRRSSTGPSASSSSEPNGAASNGQVVGMVRNVTQLHVLESYLESAKNSCAIIFFTSATCPPCKLVYPAYDELAAEAGDKATLIKVDTSQAYEIASKYQIRATPTFISFLKGEKESEWVGANESQLRGNVRLLLQMAHPPHPHTQLRLPTLQRHHRQPVTYTKIPPIEKLVAKLGPCSADPAVVSLKNFIAARQTSFDANAPLPSLPSISVFIQNAVKTTSKDSLFPIVDLFRLALVDPRMAGYYAEESSHATVLALLSTINSATDDCPYTLRIVTVQMACNLFTSPLFSSQLLSNPALATPLIHLVASSLLDTSHSQIRVAASSLAFNIAARNHIQRLDGKEDLLVVDTQVELLASLLEAVGKEEESKEGLKGLLLAIGLLAYGAPQSGELAEVCQLLEAKEVVIGKKGFDKELEGLIKEVVTVVS